MTLYRPDRLGPGDLLEAAARLGKEVTVVVELKAPLRRGGTSTGRTPGDGRAQVVYGWSG